VGGLKIVHGAHDLHVSSSAPRMARVFAFGAASGRVATVEIVAVRILVINLPSLIVGNSLFSGLSSRMMALCGASHRLDGN
jgi:hypothetical protein